MRVLSGGVPESVVVREGPVRYRAQLWTGQKTGGFLDQRENHLAAASDAGRTVRVREWRGQALDHPEILTVPETRYLKCAVLVRS